ncbi:leukocyte immunoglobulin-like receptor subfamily B member 3 isoform X2 [Malaclemys terrapin pileata]|uniref:leukocyte immunoglobulin-like receptor subfamily B member 3 isoform X2 n=1 Tax=Malaclemys terrapin pileata TaxID=2991368 RepID=UPI0023A8FBC1|nr:leukocyte immunoglobulin-like receptor subfamily B member 3 isoform X2 [Malaclemys terrapin pileata]
MASAFTVLLLSCWLAGQNGVSGEGSYPKPSISVSPGGVIPVGGNITIRCRNQHLGMRFLLYKDEDENHLNYTDPAGSEAEFPITSARREHGGSYTCRYSDRTDPAAYSEPSNPVQIIVAGGSESPAPPGLTSPIIAGVSAAATVLLLLLLLLVAFVCFRITRATLWGCRRPWISKTLSTPPWTKGKSRRPCRRSPTPALRDSPTPSWTTRRCRPSGGAQPLPPSPPSPACTPRST